LVSDVIAAIIYSFVIGIASRLVHGPGATYAFAGVSYLCAVLEAFINASTLAHRQSWATDRSRGSAAVRTAVRFAGALGGLLRSWRHDHAAVLCAFDLIELDGKDLRHAPLEERKSTLTDLLPRESDGIALNQHFVGDGASIYEHACALGCEGVVSKRLGSTYRSGRVNDWLKIKNPAAPAVRREAEEDWGAKRLARGRHRAK
jgi:hypothetical protein